jgi:hypothetical protein
VDFPGELLHEARGGLRRPAGSWRRRPRRGRRAGRAASEVLGQVREGGGHLRQLGPGADAIEHDVLRGVDHRLQDVAGVVVIEVVVDWILVGRRDVG